MKYFGIILISILSLGFGQDRSTIFNAGPPTTQEGYLLSNDGENGTVVADRFHVAEDYVLEAFYVWLKLVDSDSGSVNVKLHHDSDASPGEIIYSWDIELDPLDTILDDYLILTVGECHTMLGGNDYWLSVTVNEPDVQVLWGNSPYAFYYSSTSTDLGATWASPEQGFVGATKIYAEQIFYPGEIEGPAELGDVNLDGVVNILDIVQNVNYILGNLEFNEAQLLQADFNQDDVVNILDIVQMVNHILSGGVQYMPKFMAEDINPNSEYFGQMIGPDTFTGDISCYYFGKAG
tara:strand:- start:642 stop:1517 length:876 start_codon:yes stop_codon:yes gene_type:complete